MPSPPAPRVDDAAPRSRYLYVLERSAGRRAEANGGGHGTTRGEGRAGDRRGPGHRPGDRAALRRRGRVRGARRHQRAGRDRDRGGARHEGARPALRRLLARRGRARVRPLHRALRDDRHPGQQRRHHVRRRQALPRDGRGLLGRDPGDEPEGPLPVRRARGARDGRAPERRDHQHVERRRHALASRDGRLRRRQGRHRGAHARARARPRPLRDPRHVPGAGDDGRVARERRPGPARLGRRDGAARARRASPRTWPGRRCSPRRTTPPT